MEVEYAIVYDYLNHLEGSGLRSECKPCPLLELCGGIEQYGVKATCFRMKPRGSCVAKVTHIVVLISSNSHHPDNWLARCPSPKCPTTKSPEGFLLHGFSDYVLSFMKRWTGWDFWAALKAWTHGMKTVLFLFSSILSPYTGDAKEASVPDFVPSIFRIDDRPSYSSS